MATYAGNKRAKEDFIEEHEEKPSKTSRNSYSENNMISTSNATNQAYEQWIKTSNPSSNPVQASNNGTNNLNFQQRVMAAAALQEIRGIHPSSSANSLQMLDHLPLPPLSNTIPPLPLGNSLPPSPGIRSMDMYMQGLPSIHHHHLVNSGLQNSIVNSMGLHNSMVNSGGLQNTMVNSGGLQNGMVNTGGLQNSMVNSGGLQNSMVNSGGLQNGMVNSGGLQNGMVNSGGLQNSMVNPGGLQNSMVNPGGLQNSMVNPGGSMVNSAGLHNSGGSMVNSAGLQNYILPQAPGLLRDPCSWFTTIPTKDALPPFPDVIPPSFPEFPDPLPAIPIHSHPEPMFNSSNLNMPRNKQINGYNSNMNSLKGQNNHHNNNHHINNNSHCSSEIAGSSVTSVHNAAAASSSTSMQNGSPEDTTTLAQRIVTTNKQPPTRTYTKVYKLGSIGRAVDVTRFSNYTELRWELARMFNLDGQLDQKSGWQLVFIDHEGDILLVGDDPWEEFVTSVRGIRILSPSEVAFYTNNDVDRPAGV